MNHMARPSISSYYITCYEIVPIVIHIIVLKGCPVIKTREHSKHSMQLKSKSLNKRSKLDSKCVCAKVPSQIHPQVSQLNEFIKTVGIDGSNQPRCLNYACNCFPMLNVVWLYLSFPLSLFFSFHFELHLIFFSLSTSRKLYWPAIPTITFFLGAKLKSFQTSTTMRTMCFR